jgi:hypothetical protein
VTRGLSPAAAELEEMHDAVSPVRCPRCEAPAGARCVNPVSKLAARVPCLARIRAVDEQPGRAAARRH